MKALSAIAVIVLLNLLNLCAQTTKENFKKDFDAAENIFAKR